jgi:hypothetical protein
VCIDSDNFMPVNFILCHNLHKVKDKGAGMAIAVYVGNDKAELGFAVSIQVTTLAVVICPECSGVDAALSSSLSVAVWSLSLTRCDRFVDCSVASRSFSALSQEMIPL